jgi:hypothetical protein
LTCAFTTPGTGFPSLLHIPAFRTPTRGGSAECTGDGCTTVARHRTARDRDTRIYPPAGGRRDVRASVVCTRAVRTARHVRPDGRGAVVQAQPPSRTADRCRNPHRAPPLPPGQDRGRTQLPYGLPAPYEVRVTRVPARSR